MNLTPEELVALWKQHIRSDVPPPPAHLLHRFISIVLSKNE